MKSGIPKRGYRQISQDECPWNVRFSTELAEDSPDQPREVLAGKDARAVAREILGMTQEEFSAAFKGSPMKRAKLRGLQRNAAVALGSAGTTEDADALAHVFDDPEPLVRTHGGALTRIGGPAAVEALAGRASAEPVASLLEGWRGALAS